MDTAVRLRPERLLITSGVGIYAGAAAIGIIDATVPGGPGFSTIPGIIAAALIPLIALIGPRVPRSALAVLGPIGAALIAFAVATSNGPSDAAILYAWPILWVDYFYPTRPTAIAVASIGVAHAIALLSMPGGGNIDRWCDVMASVTIAAVVVRALAV